MKKWYFCFMKFMAFIVGLLRDFNMLMDISPSMLHIFRPSLKGNRASLTKRYPPPALFSGVSSIVLISTFWGNSDLLILNILILVGRHSDSWSSLWKFQIPIVLVQALILVLFKSHLFLEDFGGHYSPLSSPSSELP